MPHSCTLYLSSAEGLSWDDHEAVIQELQGLLFNRVSFVSFDGNILALQIPLENLDFCFDIWFDRYKGKWFDSIQVVPTNYLYWVFTDEGKKILEQRTYKVNVHYL